MIPEQLTAWALNELSPDEHLQVDTALAASPATQAHAIATQDFCMMVAEELSVEGAVLGLERRNALLALMPAPVAAVDPTLVAEPVLRSRRMVMARNHEGRADTGWKAGWGIRMAAMAACALLVGVIIFESMQPRDVIVTNVPMSTSAENIKVTTGAVAKGNPSAKSFDPVKMEPQVVQQAERAVVPTLSPSEPMVAEAKPLVAGVPQPGTVTTPLVGWGQSSATFTEAKASPAVALDLNIEPDGFALLKRSIDAGSLPSAVLRMADVVNDFHYHDVPPQAASAEPMHLSATVGTAPWAAGHRLVRIALRARDGGAEVVARGAKLEAVFNPALVRSYRLLGYETEQATALVTGADLKAGQAVTVMLEIVPTKIAEATEGLLADAPRYAEKSAKDLPLLTGVQPLRPLLGVNDELLIARVQYWTEGLELIKTMELSVSNPPTAMEATDPDFSFVSAVMGMGLLLHERSSDVTWNQVRRLAVQGSRNDADGRRAEFVKLIDRIESISHQR